MESVSGFDRRSAASPSVTGRAVAARTALGLPSPASNRRPSSTASDVDRSAGDSAVARRFDGRAIDLSCGLDGRRGIASTPTIRTMSGDYV